MNTMGQVVDTPFAGMKWVDQCRVADIGFVHMPQPWCLAKSDYHVPFADLPFARFIKDILFLRPQVFLIASWVDIGIHQYV